MCLIQPEEVETVEQAVSILEREIQDGAIAMGEHYGVGLFFDDPKNLRLYAACEQVGLPVMFHIDQMVAFRTLHILRKPEPARRRSPQNLSRQRRETLRVGQRIVVHILSLCETPASRSTSPGSRNCYTNPKLSSYLSFPRVIATHASS